MPSVSINENRASISSKRRRMGFSGWAGIAFCNQGRDCAMGIWQKSVMEQSLIVTCLARALSRVPWQSGHVFSEIVPNP